MSTPPGGGQQGWNDPNGQGGHPEQGGFPQQGQGQPQYGQQGGYPPQGQQQPAYGQQGSYPGAPQEGGYGAAPQMPGGGFAGPPAAVAKPKSIDLAQKLMYVGAVLQVLGGLAGFAMRDTIRDQIAENDSSMSSDQVDTAVTGGLVFAFILSLIFAAIWVVMAITNGKGKKWARIVATVLGVLNVVFTLLSFTQSTSNSLSKIASVISLILAIVILVLLWKRESTEYYEAKSAPQY